MRRPGKSAAGSGGCSAEFMIISQTQLAMLYVSACLLGAALGLLYDGFRILRVFLGERFSQAGNRFQNVKLPLITMGGNRKKHRKILSVVVFLEDFLFCVLAGIAIVLLVYQLNNGKIRLLIFPLAAVGFVVYRHTVGRIVMLFSETAAFLLEAGVRYVCFFLLFPWKWAISRLIGVIKKAVNKHRALRQKRDRIRYTRQCMENVEQTVYRTLIKDENYQKKEGQDAKRANRKEKTVQSEPDDAHLSGGHRGGVAGRVRQ